jgi:glycosyltransferase involved in cell wall biosynthesis
MMLARYNKADAAQVNVGTGSFSCFPLFNCLSILAALHRGLAAETPAPSTIPSAFDRRDLMSEPQVTVLMTVYNGMPYVKDAVESILKQTLTDFRFVIVDDGSDDQTPEYLRSLYDQRVTIITQSNQGTAAAANHGLQHVETPFVARMDADDIAMPDRLEKQLEFMHSHPEAGIVGTQVAPLGPTGVGKSLNLPTDHETIFSGMMVGKHGLAHSSLLIRTEILKSLGGYWKFRLIDDWDMMLRMGEVASLANIDEVLLHYRVHTGSLNGQSMKRMHRHISFAIARAQARQANRPLPTFEAFESEMEQRPAWKKIAENMHVYALANYRLAVAEIHGGKRARGYGRLAWSAICSPARTIHRLGRIFSSKKKPSRSTTVDADSAAKSGG